MVILGKLALVVSGIACVVLIWFVVSFVVVIVSVVVCLAVVVSISDLIWQLEIKHSSKLLHNVELFSLIKSEHDFAVVFCDGFDYQT